ncbi:MAG TPA: protein kinase [Longimicrobiales bacterium]|nr:protein kinase [Longimicrobiales bacterium]
MTRIGAERWGELKEVFATLVDLPPHTVATRLANLARTDPELHDAVAALLRADARVGSMPDAAEGSAISPEHATGGPDPFGFVGRTIAHFRVLDVLGGGGMGVVYRAEDVRLGRDVALKFLLPQYSFDPTAKRRFLKEARAASALHHPNVCTVYEVGESDDGHLFLAMACYAGRTLKALLAEDVHIGVSEAVRIAAQVLRGLSAAHEAGIVHRDLKPGNLLIGSDGAVRILDFGLARARDDLDLTAPGEQPGTVAYMSPEQITGDPVDARTDLWSLGVVFYEMLAGHSPFRRGHDLSTIHSILHDAPAPLSRSRPDLPAALDPVVLRLLRKNPVERYATSEEVLTDLKRAAAGRPPPGNRGRRIVAAAALMLVVLAGVTLVPVRGGMGADRTPADARPDAAVTVNSIAVLPFMNLGTDPDEKYLGDGIAEVILNVLHQFPELDVMSRASAFTFRNSDLPASEIGNRLGVRTLLGGTVRRSGADIRITAWLVDARSDRELWSQTFERRVEDIAVTEVEIANAVAGVLEVRRAAAHALGSADATTGHIAHEAYLHGLFHWHRRTPADVRQAIHYFEEAIRVDPSLARAHAGLALAWAVLPVLSGRSATDFVPSVEGAAGRALHLDPSLADAHAALGYVYHQDWRWEDAEQSFRRALELEPRHATALQWYGEHAVKMGRADEAERLLRRAVELDPLSVIAHSNLGLVLWLGGRIPEARARFEHTTRIDPGFVIAYLFLFRVHTAAGDLGGALEAGRTWAALSG